jgi:drug/metabolite transporter (DMT)-like permease
MEYSLMVSLIFFWFKALGGAETHIVLIFLYLTLFISLIYISIFLNERILISAVVGFVIIVFGVLSQYIKINTKEIDLL